MTRFVAPARPVAVLLALGLATITLVAQAQTNPPAKNAKAAAAPAAKPADTKTLSLGGGTGTGKVLTRDELRSCMKRQTTLATRRTEVEAERAPMEADKQALVPEQEALKVEREKVDALRQQVSDVNAGYKAYAERVTQWNERAKMAQDQGGKFGERDRKKLDEDMEDLQKLKVKLEADRAKLGGGADQAVSAYNARAKALEQRVAAWNDRNADLSARTRSLNADQDTWAGECADRRYREDDEIAIKRGE